MEATRYCDLMEEIKGRTKVIQSILKNETSTLFPQTNLELVYLQFRKILELIALGSLVANRNEFELQKSKFDKAYHAGDILKSIQKVNPEFYPKPVVLIDRHAPNTIGEFKHIEEGYLRKNELIKVYGMCGSVLHAVNPYRKKLDFQKYNNAIPEFLRKIIRLLNCHNIHLVGDDGFYNIYMNDESDGRVHATYFKKEI